MLIRMTRELKFMCTFLDRNISIIRLYATITLLLFLSYSYLGLMSHYSPNQVPGHNVYASAPSFGLQQINDSLNDLLLIQGNNSGNNNDTQIRKTFHSDLHEIDYFSDGKVLFYYSESDDQSASSSYYVDFGSWRISLLLS